MTILQRICLITILLVVGLVVLFFIVTGDDIERKESLSRNEATNVVNFPLVDSATNIFLYQVAGGLQSLDEYARLTVAKRDITNQINLMVVENNRQLNRNLPYARTSIISSEIIKSPALHGWDKPISWWTPEKITNGYYVGENDSYAYQIWVDENNGTLFIHLND